MSMPKAGTVLAGNRQHHARRKPSLSLFARRQMRQGVERARDNPLELIAGERNARMTDYAPPRGVRLVLRNIHHLTLSCI